MSTDSKTNAPQLPHAESSVPRSSEVIKVCIIGDVDRREFQVVQQMFTHHNQWQLHRRFDDIQAAIQEPDVVQEAQLTIVLQSWSEQFVRRQIHHLIGLTFSNRLICFCGPWCESDGRNHDLWPDAIRIPVREASTYLNDVYQAIISKAAGLPPTAAKDEVFADRSSAIVPADALQTQKRSLTNAAVIGPDASLRRTMANVLKSVSVRSAVRGLVPLVPYQTVAPVQTPQGPIHVVFHDLDPYGRMIQQSIEACAQMFPEAKLVGVANMPDAGLVSEIADEQLDTVLAKSNLLADLLHWLKKNRLEEQNNA